MSRPRSSAWMPSCSRGQEPYKWKALCFAGSGPSCTARRGHAPENGGPEGSMQKKLHPHMHLQLHMHMSMEVPEKQWHRVWRPHR